jgi:choline dehydrogenase-like flavoprotein
VAEREVILCSGTVNTPQLLMLSGIGPADHLSSLGIPVALDAPGVGRNLQNHPSYALRYACSQPVTAYKYLNPRAAIRIGLRYALTGGGSLGESYVATGGYMRSDPALAVSDTIVVMIPALVIRSGWGFALPISFPSATASRSWWAPGVRSAAAISCCAVLIRRRIREFSRNTSLSLRICARLHARCAACATCYVARPFAI